MLLYVIYIICKGIMKKIVMTILFISLFLISGCDGIQNNSITSPIMDSYYITIDSDKYSLISGDSNDYIFTKSNKEIAKITFWIEVVH